MRSISHREQWSTKNGNNSDCVADAGNYFVDEKMTENCQPATDN
jgi:hypothetical protein